MENIYFTLLFLHPGMLVDNFLHWLFPTRFLPSPLSDSVRLARYFVFSVFITLISVLIYAAYKTTTITSISCAFALLAKGLNVIEYFACSLIVTVAFSLVYYLLIFELLFFLSNTVRYLFKWPLTCRSSYVWDETKFNKDTRCPNAICVIMRDNKMYSAGIIQAWPDDMHKDPAITLVHTGEVKAAIEQKIQGCPSYLEHPKAEYILINSNTSILLFNEPKMAQGILKGSIRLQEGKEGAKKNARRSGK